MNEKITQVKVPSSFVREEYNVSHIWTGNVMQFRAERLAKVLWSNEPTQRLWWRPLQLALVCSSSSSDAKLTSLLGAPLEDQAPLHSRTDFHLLYSKMILQISPGKSLYPPSYISLHNINMLLIKSGVLFIIVNSVSHVEVTNCLCFSHKCLMTDLERAGVAAQLIRASPSGLCRAHRFES